MTQKGAEREAGGSVGGREGRTISQGDLAEGPDPNPSQGWEPPHSPTGNTGSRAARQARAQMEEPVVTGRVGDLSATVPVAGAPCQPPALGTTGTWGGNGAVLGAMAAAAHWGPGWGPGGDTDGPYPCNMGEVLCRNGRFCKV